MNLISCPFCESLVLEGFKHVEYHFLVCKNCFMQFIQRKNYMFQRVSTLKHIIPYRIKSINIQLKKYFKQNSVKIKDLINEGALSEYFSNLNKSSKSELSTSALSLSQKTQLQMQLQQSSENELAYKLNDQLSKSNYETVKSKISQKYNTLQESIRQNQTYKHNMQKIQKCKQKLSESKVQFSNKLKHYKDGFNNIKSELPSIKDMKIGSFIKSSIFKWM